MARAAPSDAASPVRLIATMVGIVGILLLGSLTWSAVGQVFAAFGDAAASLAPRPTPTRLPAAVPVPVVVAVFATPTIAVPAAPTPTVLVVATPTSIAATPTAETATGRVPWILLPRPEPGSRVAPGQVSVEARARADAPIASISLDLDGTPLGVSLEQRSESTWRGFATARVGPGQHVVRARAVDDQGRSGASRWSFDASP